MKYKLEALRGIAAIMVVIYHTPFKFEAPLLIKNSFLFVDFFFILSGFVISLAYSKKIGDGIPFKKFIHLRLGRLYPIHIFTLLVWLLFFLIKFYAFGPETVNPRQNPSAFISNMLLMH